MALVDELGSLQAEIAQLSEKFDRIKELKAKFVDWASAYPDEQAVVFEGMRYLAEVSAKSNERSITDLRKVCDMVGAEKFFAAASLTLKALDELLPAVERKLVTVEKQHTGPRSVKTLQRAAVVPIVGQTAA